MRLYVSGFLLALLALSAGCRRAREAPPPMMPTSRGAPPPSSVGVNPTRSPAVATSGQPFSLSQGRVLVLSPRSIQQVAASVTWEGPGPGAPQPTVREQDGHQVIVMERPEPTSGQTAANVDLVSDFSLVTAAVERRMISSGWTTISQASLASAATNHEDRVRTFGVAGVRTLLEQALAIGGFTGAETIFLVRAVRLEYAGAIAELGRPGCQTIRYYPLEGVMDATLVRVADGEVLWTGRASVRATDLLREPVSLYLGSDVESHLDFDTPFEPHLATISDGCEATTLLSAFCINARGDDACRSQEPTSWRVESLVLDELVRRLVDDMSRLSQAPRTARRSPVSGAEPAPAPAGEALP